MKQKRKSKEDCEREETQSAFARAQDELLRLKKKRTAMRKKAERVFGKPVSIRSR